MKTKKFYWRLAFVLSLIPVIVWTIVWLVNGSLPTWLDDDHHWSVAWMFDALPFLTSRWYDSVGLFFIVMIFHNVSVKKIWDPDPKGFVQTLFYGLVIVICIFGFLLFLIMIVEVNLLFGFFVFVLCAIITTGILYLAQQIPVDWQERIKYWIMQKSKEEKL